MAHRFSDLTFTPKVIEMQKHFGTDMRNANMRDRGDGGDHLSRREKEFIQSRDSFFMATVNEDGWPYIQHRGGDIGFLKVVDPHTLAFTNFTGNGQYQSLGNLSADDRVSLFLIDYPTRQRLKILGHATVMMKDELTEEFSELLDKTEYPARIESLLVIRVVAFDWNCSQYITPRFSEAELNNMKGKSL